MQQSNGKKVTISTIKSFIKREAASGNLYIRNDSDFDGQTDCVQHNDSPAFRKVTLLAPSQFSTDTNNRLSIPGAWFVGGSRDYFTPYADDKYIGYEVYNCCGSFILAMARK